MKFKSHLSTRNLQNSDMFLKSTILLWSISQIPQNSENNKFKIILENPTSRRGGYIRRLKRMKNNRSIEKYKYLVLICIIIIHVQTNLILKEA